MRKGNCKHCGKEFKAKLNSKVFCSKSCGARYRTLQVNPKQITQRICKRCGKDYEGTYSSKFCSKKCLKKEPKKCGHCGEEFEGHFNSRYCSMKCKDAFKVRKDTGEVSECIVCSKQYSVTYGKRRNINQVCSNRCANSLGSKHGKYLDIKLIENIVINTPYQMSASMVADKIKTSTTNVYTKASEKYGSYKNMIISLKGRYVNSDDSRSQTANSLFAMIEDIYDLKGNYEKEFDDLTNPLTNQNLRIDFYIEEMPLAIEYHGEQHYKPSEFFDKTDSFKARKTRDKIKQNYLEKNKIPLVVFSYFDELTEETVRNKLDRYFK